MQDEVYQIPQIPDSIAVVFIAVVNLTTPVLIVMSLIKHEAP